MSDEDERRDAIIACLGDDAAAIRSETGNPEDERASNMDEAAELIDTIREELAQVKKGRDEAAAAERERIAKVLDAHAAPSNGPIGILLRHWSQRIRANELEG